MRNNPIKPACAAALALALAFTFSCSGDGGGGRDPRSIRKERISGVSQKGPFAAGASVTIYELDENLEKTKNYFAGKTEGNGNFDIEIKNGELASPYVIVKVNGYYASESSGEPSAAPITLNAVADVSGKNSVNVNVLTHLEYGRVLMLAKGGMKFGDAKKEAQKEVLNALGISEGGIAGSENMNLFGSSASDSVLLAVSILLEGGRPAGGVSRLLSAFGGEMKESGALGDSLKAEIANGLADVDMGKVRESILALDSSARVPSFGDIADMVAKIDSAAVLPKDPDLPPGSSSSSLAKSSSSAATSPNSAAASSGSAAYIPPRSTSTAPSEPVPASSSATPSSSSAEPGSSSAEELSSSSEAEQSSSSSVEPSSSSSSEEPSSSSEEPGSSSVVYGSMADDGGQTYKTVAIGTQTWMAENLNYNASGSKCYGNNDANCATYGRLYDWNTAMAACPSGWHLPSDAEWTTLTDFVGGESTAGTKLKANSGLWSTNTGTDDYGFTALPGGEYRSSGSFYVGNRGHWWTDKYNDYRLIYYNEAYVYSGHYTGDILYSVRCLQD